MSGRHDAARAGESQGPTGHRSPAWLQSHTHQTLSHQIRHFMSDFKTVAKVGDIPDGEARAYECNGVMIAVFHVAGEYTAMDDACPHQGAPLSEGYIEGDCVTCPWHAWRFSVKDGRWLDSPQSKLKVETYPVRVEDDQIQVNVPD